MKNQSKLSRIKNDKFTNKKKKKKKKMTFPLKGYVASEIIFKFRAKNKKMHCGNISD